MEFSYIPTLMIVEVTSLKIKVFTLLQLIILDHRLSLLLIQSGNFFHSQRLVHWWLKYSLIETS